MHTALCKRRDLKDPFIAIFTMANALPSTCAERAFRIVGKIQTPIKSVRQYAKMLHNNCKQLKITIIISAVYDRVHY